MHPQCFFYSCHYDHVYSELHTNKSKIDIPPISSIGITASIQHSQHTATASQLEYQTVKPLLP